MVEREGGERNRQKRQKLSPLILQSQCNARLGCGRWLYVTFETGDEVPHFGVVKKKLSVEARTYTLTHARIHTTAACVAEFLHTVYRYENVF
uniref:Uncharacterized protein n=1 Tax=Anguilla anguilla TaxID=7936 RepID=A0A0E9UEZ7_ANGAN